MQTMLWLLYTVLGSQDCLDSQGSVLQTLTMPSMALTLSGLSLPGSLLLLSTTGACVSTLRGLWTSYLLCYHSLFSGKACFLSLAHRRSFRPVLDLLVGWPIPSPDT